MVIHIGYGHGDTSSFKNWTRLIMQGAVDKAFYWKVLLSEIIWKLQVQSQQKVRITRNIYYDLILVFGHGCCHLPEFYSTVGLFAEG